MRSSYIYDIFPTRYKLTDLWYLYRFQTLIVYLAPVPYILYLTRWSARGHGRHGRQHNDQGEQVAQSQYTQSISGRHQWRHHLPGHQSQGRASGLRKCILNGLIHIDESLSHFSSHIGNRPGVHGRSGQDQTSRQSFYWARPDTNGGRHERYFNGSSLSQSWSIFIFLVTHIRRCYGPEWYNWASRWSA